MKKEKPLFEVKVGNKGVKSLFDVVKDNKEKPEVRKLSWVILRKILVAKKLGSVELIQTVDNAIKKL